jgi:hypothetical protein
MSPLRGSLIFHGDSIPSADALGYRDVAAPRLAGVEKFENRSHGRSLSPYKIWEFLGNVSEGSGGRAGAKQ